MRPRGIEYSSGRQRPAARLLRDLALRPKPRLRDGTEHDPLVKTIIGRNVDQLTHEVLPVTFDRTADARGFMDRYIDQVYNGRGGYEAEHQSWWACDATSTAKLHRYTLVDEARTGS
jgi:hypothetical protein